MKVIRFSLTFLLSAITVFNAKAQTNWAEIGDPDWGPYCIWKIQVLDDYNEQPLVDSKVELLRDNFKLVSIRTNQNGTAIIIINDITKLDNNEKLIIRDNNYEYNRWEIDIYQMVLMVSLNCTKSGRLKMYHYL